MKITQNDTQKVLLCVFWVKVIQNDAQNQFLSVFWVKVIQNDTQRPVFECILTEKCVIGCKIDRFQYIFEWHTMTLCVQNGETDRRIWNKWAPLSITDHLLHLYHNTPERNYLKTIKFVRTHAIQYYYTYKFCREISGIGIPMARGNSPMHSAYIQGGLKNAASLARVKMSIFTRWMYCGV